MRRALVFLKGIYHYQLAWLGNIIYRRPSRDIIVIGVTGTKGKTTTVELVASICEAAGKRVAVSSSIHTKIGDKVFQKKTSNSMPGRFFLKRFLRRAVDAKCDIAILEVTSQGVVQHRARFIDFEICVFLNIAPEHIESHGSFEAYRDAKVKFFKDAARDSRKPQKYFVMNEHDAATEYFHKAIIGQGESIFFTKDTTQQFQLSDWLSSDFNRDNAAAAIAVANCLHIDAQHIAHALRSFQGILGRMEYVVREPFAVVVDYAHTPDSLQSIYKALRARHRGRLICILGSAGGGRDTWKRPKMGGIAGHMCDEIILTDEDPYDEDPLQIVMDIKQGVTDTTKPIYVIMDRKEAIQKALAIAQAGDVVVMTGKGAERGIHIKGGKVIPWSDQKKVRDILRDTLYKR